MCLYIYVIRTYVHIHTEIPTIIDPSATVNYPSATGSIIVGISVYIHITYYHVEKKLHLYGHGLVSKVMAFSVCVCVLLDSHISSPPNINVRVISS